MSENLYELSRSVDLIVQEVVDAEGELTPDLEKRLNEISLQFKDKASNVGKWILNIDSNADAIKREIERLEGRKRVQENLKKRLMEYLKFCMENAGLNKVDLQTFTVSIIKNPPSVEVNNEEKLPAKYIKIDQIKSIDKSQLLKDMKSGEQVEGAHLITDKTHIRIK